MRLRSVVLTSLFAVFGLAHAQAPSPPKPTPEEMQRMMASTGAMLPTLARMTEVQLEGHDPREGGEGGVRDPVLELQWADAQATRAMEQANREGICRPQCAE